MLIASKPPSTTSSVPVMKLPASDASNNAAPISSLDSPKRFIGVLAMIEATRSGLSTLRFCSAGKNPGTRMFTRTSRGRPFAREIFGKIMQRGFRRRVGEHARQRIQSRRRAEIDDTAGFLFDHVLPKNLAGQHQSLQIHCDDFVEFLLCDLKKRRRRFTPAPFTKTSTWPNLASTSARSFCNPILDVVSQGKKFRLAAIL